ncbi:hypothetical protein J1614_007161 [Plenodomus biglobosus]|nr:hypothetical protein J1614_007161 [Plenodomus biglobosus]
MRFQLMNILAILTVAQGFATPTPGHLEGSNHPVDTELQLSYFTIIQRSSLYHTENFFTFMPTFRGAVHKAGYGVTISLFYDSGSIIATMKNELTQSISVWIENRTVPDTLVAFVMEAGETAIRRIGPNGFHKGDSGAFEWRANYK